MLGLVGDALELPADARKAFVAERCGDDAEMLTEALSLLSQSFLSDTTSITEGLDIRVGRAASWIATEEGTHPDRIGPYVILQVLGEGGMGIVYGAHQVEPLERDVAVKVLRGGARVSHVIGRFETERRALASLDHPHIAHIFDAGDTDTGLPYFAMEWVRGVTLIRYCDEHRLALRERLELFRKVLAAVHHAHQNGIIHCDLKPSNVLVGELEGRPVPKVIDFGIARVEKEAADLEGEGSLPGRAVGTLEYMSPEQALALPAGPGTRSDIYALGVLLHELLTGVLPVASGTLRAADRAGLERLLLHTDPPAPSRRATEGPSAAVDRAAVRGTSPSGLSRALRGDLDAIVARATRPDPMHRYASVAHLSDDIERYLERRPVKARPSTWAYRTRRFVDRHRWSAAGTGTGVMVILGMAGVFTLRLATERDRAQLEADKAVQVASFLQDLFTVPDPVASATTDVTARQLLDEGAERISTELEGQPALQASLLSIMANTYRGLGLYGESVLRMEEALGLQRDLYDGTHPDIATNLHTLGLVRTERGDLARAERNLREALTLRLALHGDHDPATASTMTALAITLRARGAYEEAEAMARNGLSIHRLALGPVHRDIASDLHTLAHILRSRGALEEAETLNREALSMRRRLLDASHPEVLSSMGNLAIVLEARGTYEEANSLLREVFELRRARLGADHPGTLASLNNLAYMLWRSGRQAQADTLFFDAVVTARRIFPADHPTLAITLNNLGVARRTRGDFAQAESLHREALAMDRRLLGDEHPRVAGDLDNLGKTLLVRGDAVAAERVHREALAMRTATQGADHPDLAESLSGIAHARLAQGDTASAEPLLRRALTVRTDRLGEDNPRTATSAHELGAFLRQVGRTDEAERWLRQALATRQTALDSGHPDVSATRRELTLLLGGDPPATSSSPGG